MRKKKVMAAVSLFFVMAMLCSGCGKADGQAQEKEDKQEMAPAAEDELQGQQATPGGQQEESRMQVPSFTAKDLDGNAVTEEIFAGKDLTVVNVWGTFCPPCIGEMPELGEWARDMPENVQIVGLIVDIEGDEDTEHHDLAVEITEKAGADFVQIIANSDFGWALGGITGVPTTFFVDKEGCIVGNAVIGADVDRYKEVVEGYLDGQ